MKKYNREADNRWEEFRKLLDFPSWITTRKQYQAERLLEFVVRLKVHEQYTRELILSSNPHMSKDWPGSNHLQDAIAAEAIITRFLTGRRLNKANAKKGGQRGKRTPDADKIATAAAILKANPLKKFSNTRAVTLFKAHGLEVSKTWVQDHKEKFRSR